ncbi:MAG: tol-pal system protein YbgF [Gammaproteobacteria bacterium]|nr:tol-pal system protein YbgF [Gammaproteobacteria bacterium]
MAKLNKARFSSLSAVLLCICGCATTPPSEDPVLLKLTELENRLVTIERVVNNQSLVSLQGQLDQLNVEMRELRGQIEVLQYEAQEAGKRQRTQYLDVDGRLQKLERGGLAAVSTGATPDADGSDKVAYEQAFELLKNTRYTEAKAALTEFATAYPDSTLADNASYWLGEAHYVTADYAAALAQFEKMIGDFPASSKVPDALLKVAYCQYELKQFDQARNTLNSVINTYPNTTPARLATQRLQQMQKEGR